MGIETSVLLGYAASAAAAVGTAVSVYSSMEQRDAAKDLAAQQAKQAQEDAAYAASQAEVQARQIRKATDRQRAEARASLASSGVSVGVGTAEQIDQDIQRSGEEDALMAIYDGKNNARGIYQSGQLASTRSRNAASAAGTNAWTSALQGGATLARGWSKA